MLFSPTAVTIPPPAATPESPGVTVLAEEETGPLYAAVVDAVNDLTYIDICVVDKKTGRKVPPGQAKK